MPVLVDYSQVVLASLFMAVGNHTEEIVQEDAIRHMFLNSLRANRKQFKDKYGEIVICVDDRANWRKEVFPYYKASRKKSREESGLDWDELFRIIAQIKDELKENFPYKVIQIPRCEADDIIGTIVHEYGTPLWDGSSEKFLILSGDKDYKQLLSYANVDQYSPTQNKFLYENDPELFLKEHILKGDKGDGVPNILSPDNSIVIGERQGTMTAKRLKNFLDGNFDHEQKRRFDRNTELIDLSRTPDDLKEEILEAYAQEPQVKREKLFNFFIKKRLKTLMGFIQDF